jgi:hypothetical protein
MDPELEALLKAWDAYLQAQEGQEADRLLALYDTQLPRALRKTRLE